MGTKDRFKPRTTQILIDAIAFSLILVYDWYVIKYNLFLDDEYCIQKFIEETSNDGYNYWNVTVGPIVPGESDYTRGMPIRFISAYTEWQGQSVYWPYAGVIRRDLKIFYSRLD